VQNCSSVRMLGLWVQLNNGFFLGSRRRHYSVAVQGRLRASEDRRHVVGRMWGRIQVGRSCVPAPMIANTALGREILGLGHGLMLVGGCALQAIMALYFVVMRSRSGIYTTLL